ncbi:extracellular solute-binding protein, partial [Anoxybacillus sp. LAT_33]
MKKVLSLFLLVWLIAFSLLYVTKMIESSEGYGGNNTLTIYNWGDYIDPALIKKFEKETGLKVIYQTFDSNEAMMTKISQGGATFDVAVPSEYAISKMKEEGLLLPIDHAKIPNLRYIDDRFLNLSFDP